MSKEELKRCPKCDTPLEPIKRDGSVRRDGTTARSGMHCPKCSHPATDKE